jgi:hypothetical protein
VDRDTHKNFDEAADKSGKESEIDFLPSYPCFEYWYLLHYSDSRKPYSMKGNKSPADCLIADLRKCKGMEKYDKGSTIDLYQLLCHQLSTARKRSHRILTQAVQDGDLNPSTRIHELFIFFDNLANLTA